MADWCDEMMLAEIAERTSGLCVKCWRERNGQRISEIEIRNMGRRVELGAHPRDRTNGKGNRGRQRQVERAKRRARKRLAMMFPELYDIFLAEERARVGLDPWPADAALTEGDARSTLDFAAVYHALDEHGVDVDGPAVEPETEDGRSER